MRKNGFSLIELMVAMAVLTILATVAVPKVQMWNARNRGLKTVMELLSDFSKARSVAGYTVVGTNDNSINIPVNIKDFEDDAENAATMPVYMGVRRQTAMIFRRSEYAIYQKQSMDTGSWDSSALMLKKNLLLNTVTLENVNKMGQPGDDDFETFINFNSNGSIKQANGDLMTVRDSGQCGTAVAANTLPFVVFSAIIRSRISLNSDDSIWYRLDIDKGGQYSICTLFSSSDVDYDAFKGNDATLLDI